MWLLQAAIAIYMVLPYLTRTISLWVRLNSESAQGPSSSTENTMAKEEFELRPFKSCSDILTIMSHWPATAAVLCNSKARVVRLRVGKLEAK